MKQRVTKPPLLRMRTKYLVSDGCWDWIGCKSRGYGRIYVDGHLLTAHRTMYEILVGPIPAGMQLDHLCRNRGCIRPSHLEVVTCKENVLRGVGLTARAAAVTHCPQGHPYDETNTYRPPGRKGRHCLICKRERNRVFMREFYRKQRRESA